MVLRIDLTMDIFRFGRKRLVAAALVTFICCGLMVVFPTTALYSARKGISLWMTDVLPALLPFFICANFLQSIGVIRLLKSGVFPFIMSVLSGYPMGAKIIGDLKRQDEISLNEACRLMSFCSTSGPAFMVGAVGAGMLGSGTMGAIIAAAHYAGALANGVLFTAIFGRDGSSSITTGKLQQRSLQESFTESIVMSLKSLGIILAYIVLFMFVTDLLHLSGVLSLAPGQEMRALIKGILEMTVGCSRVCSMQEVGINIKTTLCTFLVSFGGLSVTAQTAGVLRGTDISMSHYIRAKLMHGLISAALTVTMIFLQTTK